MLRKVAPVVLLFGGMFVAAAVWAQDASSSRTQGGPLTSIREFILGDDPDSQPIRQPRRGDARAGERVANDNVDDDSDNGQSQRMRSQQQQQSMPKNDNPWDKRFKSNGPSFASPDTTPSSSSSNNRRPQQRSDAPA